MLNVSSSAVMVQSLGQRKCQAVLGSARECALPSTPLIVLHSPALKRTASKSVCTPQHCMDLEIIHMHWTALQKLRPSAQCTAWHFWDLDSVLESVLSPSLLGHIYSNIHTLGSNTKTFKHLNELLNLYSIEQHFHHYSNSNNIFYSKALQISLTR